MAVQAAYATKVTAGSGVASSALTESDVANQYNIDNGTGLATPGTGRLTVKASKDANAQTYTVTLTPITGGKSFQAVTKADVQ